MLVKVKRVVFSFVVKMLSAVVGKLFPSRGGKFGKIQQEAAKSITEAVAAPQDLAKIMEALAPPQAEVKLSPTLKTATGQRRYIGGGLLTTPRKDPMMPHK